MRLVEISISNLQYWFFPLPGGCQLFSNSLIIDADMRILFTCVHTFVMQVVGEFVNSSQKLYAHAQHV